VTYAYFMTLRPGAVRGWSVHLRQAGLLFLASGAVNVALYDGREDSSSLGRVNVFFLGTPTSARPRVPWGNLPQNIGSQSLPNNRGVALARGEYVAYLGHDDLWLPTHLAHLVSALQQSRAGLAWSSVEAIGPPGSNVRRVTGLRRKPPSAVLHRRDVVEVVGGWRH